MALLQPVACEGGRVSRRRLGWHSVGVVIGSLKSSGRRMMVLCRKARCWLGWVSCLSLSMSSVIFHRCDASDRNSMRSQMVTKKQMHMTGRNPSHERHIDILGIGGTGCEKREVVFTMGVVRPLLIVIWPLFIDAENLRTKNKTKCVQQQIPNSSVNS